METTRHIDLGGRGSIRQATSLEEEVANGHIVSILIGAREDNLTLDGQGAKVVMVSLCGDEEHVLVLQGNVSLAAIQDALQIDGQHLLRTVRLHAAHDSTTGQSLLGESLTTFYQRLDAEHLLAQLIHARTEYSTLDFDHVLIAVVHGIH